MTLNPVVQTITADEARRLTERIRATLRSSSVVAYAYWVLSHIDHFQAANFWVAMVEKVDLKSGDPVIALSNRCAEVRRTRQAMPKKVLPLADLPHMECPP